MKTRDEIKKALLQIKNKMKVDDHELYDFISKYNGGYEYHTQETLFEDYEYVKDGWYATGNPTRDIFLSTTELIEKIYLKFNW